MIFEEQCVEILKRHNPTVKFVDFSIKKFSENVLGFLGDHQHLSIIYTEANGLKKISKFFLKTALNTSEDHIEYANEMGVFEKEAKLYKNILLHFHDMFKTPFLPRVYLTDSKEFIVLEDLKLNGYSIIQSPFTLKQCEAVLRSLAQLHAASIIYEENRRITVRNYKLLDEFPEELKEVSFSPIEGHPRNKWCENVLNAVLYCIKRIPEYQHFDKLDGNLRDFVHNSIYDLIKPSETYRNCVTHCDLWCNNMMFKSSKENNLNCILIDFQFARYIPPAYDVLLTLYLNISYDQLDENLEQFLLFYYKHFKNCLQEHNINIKDILPLSEFWDCVEFYKKLAVVEATWFGTIAFTGDELAKKITTNKEVFNEFLYTNRWKYLVQEYECNLNYKSKIDDLIKQIVLLFND